MPGILPMKVIKVGNSSQARIAQACDRCRSKKIRCDGIRPCCSQCAAVGFECKTSDKLSRRAFPRGYTESLEERVRQLESEVRELKDLLDEKDEKIDMLSRIHSHSPPAHLHRVHSGFSLSPPLQRLKKESSESSLKEDTFTVQQSPFLRDSDESDSYFIGASSGRAFVDAFKRKIRESGKQSLDLNVDLLLKTQKVPGTDPVPTDHDVAPPRLVSDQLINVFFQEWAPLFPVLHRPTFLATYEKFVSSSEDVEDTAALVQLYLVFCIAAMSSESNLRDIECWEKQWKTGLEKIQKESNLTTVQCLILAQIYFVCKADYKALLHYKGVSVGLSHRLGLHQSQKRLSVGALTSETRKKVFWTFYTLDCFSASILGLPKLLKEDDIHAEYPADIDDEYVTEKGFQPTLPGECTKISSALALFRATRILSRVLEEIYPAAGSHELSLGKINAIGEDLDAWLNDLPNHLRLQFAQDKPSTNVISSRSPLLSLAYYYIRSLIHRPTAGSSLGSRSSSSVLILGDSSKHIIQIIQLLEERGLSFSFCLNKDELLILSGFGLLFQCLDLNPEGKLIKDQQRLLSSVSEILERRKAPGVSEFKKTISSMMTSSTTESKKATSSRRKSDGNMPAPLQQPQKSNVNRPLKAITSRLPFSGHSSKEDHPKQSSRIGVERRATVAAVGQGQLDHLANLQRTQSRLSIDSAQSEPATVQYHQQQSRPELQHSTHSPPIKLTQDQTADGKLSGMHSFTSDFPNLDYFPFSTDPTPTSYQAMGSSRSTHSESPLVWDRLISSLDTSNMNTFPSAFDADAYANSISLDTIWPGNSSDPTSAFSTLLPDMSASAGIGLLGPCLPGAPSTESPSSLESRPADSVVSFEDDGSLGTSSANDELQLPTSWEGKLTLDSSESCPGISMPNLMVADEDYPSLESLGDNFGL